MEIVHIGTSGKAVEQLQHMLNSIGYDLQIDGIFSEETHTAVVDFQRALSLTVDGIVGDITWTFLVNVKTLRDENPLADYRKEPVDVPELLTEENNKLKHKANRDI